MAETLAAVGIGANIVQLVDFGTTVLKRVAEFQSKLDSVPKSLEHLTLQLPLVLTTVKGTQRAVETGTINNEVENALLPVIHGCTRQIELLDSLISKLLPLSTDSWSKRSKKAILSLKQDSKIDEIASNLRGYIQTLTFYHTAVQSSLSPEEGT